MKENNIALVLDAVGEKIAALELALHCERYNNTELEKQIEHLKVGEQKDLQELG